MGDGDHGQLWMELAELKGQVSAIDANQVRMLAVLVQIEQDLKKKQSWRDRAAWLYAGAVTAAGIGWGALRALGKI